MPILPSHCAGPVLVPLESEGEHTGLPRQGPTNKILLRIALL